MSSLVFFAGSILLQRWRVVDREEYEKVEREKLIKFISQIQLSLNLPSTINEKQSNYQLRRQFAELAKMSAHKLEAQLSRGM